MQEPKDQMARCQIWLQLARARAVGDAEKRFLNDVSHASEHEHAHFLLLRRGRSPCERDAQLEG
eukprot:2819951-Pleurochrysis_carterae.AAC.2